MNCGTCKHFTREHKKAKEGVCRRYPPTVFIIGLNTKVEPPAPMTMTIWPGVAVGLGCGEHEQSNELGPEGIQ